MRGVRRVSWSVALMAALTPLALGAQGPSIHAQVDTTAVTVGGRVELTVTVEHPPSSSVIWPDSLDLAPFEVVDAVVLPTTSAEGRAVSRARLSLTAFELGELEIPSIEVGVLGEDSTLTALSTDPFGIGVESVGLDEGGDIREIRGPLSIPRSLMFLLPWLLLVAALTAVGAWAYQRRRKAAPTPERTRAMLPALPHEEAYAALDRLEGERLLERGEIKEYHILVSEIIRTYVEGRFDVYALEMTTREVLDGLRAHDLGKEILGAFGAFLDRCDLVKFARLRPGVDACLEVMAIARRLVDETKPRPALLHVDGDGGREAAVGAGSGEG